MAASRPSLSAAVVKISCLAVLLAGINPAFCQNETTLKSVRGPFHPFSMEQTWGQKICEVQNPTEQNQALSIKTKAQDNTQGKMEFRRDFIIPAQSSRLVTLGMQFGSFENIAQAPTEKSKSLLSKFNQTFTLNRTDNGTQLSLQQGLMLGVPAKMFRMAIVNGEESDSVAYFKDDVTCPFGTIQFLSSGGAENLPTTWYGYSILDILMVGPVDDAKILPAQFAALENWVRKGGKLLIFCGNGSYEQLSGKLGKLAGVYPIGFHHTDKFTVDGNIYKLDKPTYFTELAADGAEVLATSDTLPLVTSKRTGMGVVIVVSCSLNALKPQGDFNVWKDIAEQVRAQHAIVTENFSHAVAVKETVKVENPTPQAATDKNKNPRRKKITAGPRYISKTKNVVPGMATLQEIAGRKAPDRTLPCGILGGLAAATILFGALLRIRRRGEMLWMLMVPAVVLISAGMFYMGQHSSDTARLSNVGYVTVLGNGQSHVQEFYVFYPGPKAVTETFGSGCPNGIIMPAGESTLAGMMTQTIATTDTQMAMPDNRIKPYATSSFFVETVTDYDPMSVSLSFDTAGAIAKITNHLKQPVENAVLFANMRTMSIASIKPGENTIRITNANELAEGEFTSSLFQQDTKWNDLISLMLDRGGFHNTITAPRVIGYLDGGVVAPLGKTAIATQGVSVLDVPVTLTPVKAGTAVNIPAAFLPTDIMNLQTPVWNTATREFNSCTRPSKMIYLVGLPKNISKLKNPSIELSINIQAPGYTLRVAKAKLVQKDASRHKVDAIVSQIYQSVDNPAGIYNISIPNADKLPVQDGMMTICLEITKLESNIAKTISAINVMGSSNQATWKIVSITPILKGTVE